MTERRPSLHVVVYGRVQGVGFRTFVEGHARQQNLDGWVRNRRDGTVEAVFCGSQQAVESMAVACRNGPVSAKVDRVETRDATVDDIAVSGERGFRFLPTV